MLRIGSDLHVMLAANTNYLEYYKRQEGMRDSLTLHPTVESLQLEENIVGSCTSTPDKKRRIPTSNDLAYLLLVHRILTMIAHKHP